MLCIIKQMALLENGLQSRSIAGQGTLTLNGVTNVNVAFPLIERLSVVVLSLNTVGVTATNVGQPWVSTITLGTGFTVRGITATADDIYNYVVYNPH